MIDRYTALRLRLAERLSTFLARPVCVLTAALLIWFGTILFIAYLTGYTILQLLNAWNII